MKSKISIIIPVYNAEQHISKCLESVLQQSYQNLQIICVDDGSQDESLMLLKEYQKHDPRIEIISKCNEGVSLARNIALDIIDGEYLLFVDSDDWLETDTCKNALESAEKHSADVVMWPYIREINGKSRKKEIFLENVIFEEYDVKNKLYRRMIGLYKEELRQPENADALCTVWGKLYKKDIIIENNIRFYDIREIGTYEDGLFNLNVFKYAKRVCYINQYLYHYRRDDVGSITNRYNVNLQKQWDTLFDILKKYIEDNNLDSTHLEALDNRISLSLIPLGINEMTKNTSEKNKVKSIQKIICHDKYRRAVKSLELHYLPVHWKVFFQCAKVRFGLGVYILLFVIQKIRGR